MRVAVKNEQEGDCEGAGAFTSVLSAYSTFDFKYVPHKLAGVYYATSMINGQRRLRLEFIVENNGHHNQFLSHG